MICKIINLKWDAFCKALIGQEIKKRLKNQVFTFSKWCDRSKQND